ncbi:hypothetical protein EU527_10095 [Candidatus Thorarchaeota archaeon]|nr:MAG: hypothetical protein EU527_10095 [Candidatus Thorarchaeota archaeon]
MSDNLHRPAVQHKLNPSEILGKLNHYLLDSFKQIKDISRCAVLFSGGVDSSLAAVLTKKQCEETLLITARCDNSYDAKASVRAAKTMSIDMIEVRIDSDSLWQALPDVIRSIGQSKRMDVEIAIPFYFAAREAKKREFSVMVSGQGPDELFGGYARYEKIMIEQGPEEVEAALWRDVSVTDKANIQRDARVLCHHGLQPFFPYLYPDFVNLALSIPATLNIDPTKKPARKLMFRQLAMKMGVPKEIAMEQKRATQYSSGTSKMLIESMRDNFRSFRNLSKREIQSAMQESLDQINHQQSMEE